MIDKACLDCGCYDSDLGCTCPSLDKWYVCPLEPEPQPEDFMTQEEIHNELVEFRKKYEESCKEVEKLKRENFGLKTTVKNLRRQLDKFYRYR